MAEKFSGVLRTRCILHPAEVQDGHRVSVMSRHTLNDGMTDDSRLAGQFDEHRPELALPPKLVGDHYKRKLPWRIFVTRYLDHLTGPVQRASMEEILALLHSVNVTLLCIEASPDFCHRRLLAEALAELWYGVQVEIG